MVFSVRLKCAKTATMPIYNAGLDMTRQDDAHPTKNMAAPSLWLSRMRSLAAKSFLCACNVHRPTLDR